MKPLNFIIAVVLIVTAMAVAPGMFICQTPPPVGAILSDWQLSVSITDHEAEVGLKSTGVVLDASRSEPVSIPLFPRGTVFRDLTLNGKPLVPIRCGKWFHAEISEPGEFMVTAALSIRPVYDRGQYSIRFTKPESTQWSVKVDSEQALDVWISGVKQAINGAEQHGTHGTIALPPKTGAELIWRDARRKVTRRGVPTLRPSVAWKVEDRSLSAEMDVEVDIVGGPNNRLNLILPADSDKVAVTGHDVRGFRHQGRELEVFLERMMSGRTGLRISFLVPRPKGNLVDFPGLEVEHGRIVAGGWTLVCMAAKGILLEHAVKGYTTVSDLDIPPHVFALAEGKPRHMYKRVERLAELVVDHVRAEPFPVVETIADRADFLTLIRPGGEEITSLVYRIRNNRKQFLSVRLPDDVSIVSAKVENRVCSVVFRDNCMLIPLVKSVQTRSGLVPFPVEIIYCRQRSKAAMPKSLPVDLPELEDIPVALVNVTVRCPDGTRLLDYGSKLKLVDDFEGRRNAWFLERTWPVSDGGQYVGIDRSIKKSLVRNYYESGYESYRDNRLEEAESFLSKAAKMATSTWIAEDSAKLLDNIRVARREIEGKTDRIEKAKIARIQDSVTTGNTRLEAKQNALIRAGIAELESGDQELAGELLKKAEKINMQLAQRNVSAVRRKAMARQYKTRLSKLNKVRARNRELKSKLRKLQKQTEEFAGGMTEGGADDKARWLGAALTRSARFNRVDVSEAQKAAFGDVSGEDEQSSDGDLTKGAQAARYESGMKGWSRKRKAKKSAPAKRESLEEKNRVMARRVKVLEQALKEAVTEQERLESEQPRVGEVVRLLSETGEVKEKLRSIARRLTSGDELSDMKDIELQERLERLRRWTSLSKSAYGSMDPRLMAEFKALEETIESVSGRIEQTRKRRLSAGEVCLRVDDIVGNASPARSRAFEDFISRNYLPQVHRDEVQFRVSRGELNVLNVEGNSELLNEVVQKLRKNDGQVVTVSGRRIPIEEVSKLQALKRAFSGRTSDGRAYGILDEAQYRTLIEISNQTTASGIDETVTREVAVGTGNEIADEHFRVARSGSGWNEFTLGGVRVRTPHDRYFAIDNGDYVSVIKAGETHIWTEQNKALASMKADVFRIEIPKIGVFFKFAKTLLGAGESPDIEIEAEM